MKANTVTVTKIGEYQFSIDVYLGSDLFAPTVESPCHFELQLSQYVVLRYHTKQVQALYIWVDRFQQLLAKEPVKSITLKRYKELAQEVTDSML